MEKMCERDAKWVAEGPYDGEKGEMAACDRHVLIREYLELQQTMEKMRTGVIERLEKIVREE